MRLATASAVRARAGRTTQISTTHPAQTVRLIGGAPSRRSEKRIPPALDALILACLEKSPDERPDAATLAGRLAAYAADDPWTEGQARAWWENHLPAATP